MRSVHRIEEAVNGDVAGLLYNVFVERAERLVCQCSFENAVLGWAGLDGHMGWMWSKEHRARQLAFEQGRRYPTDRTDEEWERVRLLLPKPPRRGRKPGVDVREVLNAIRYMARSGGGWRMLPVHFGPWETVY